MKAMKAWQCKSKTTALVSMVWITALSKPESLTYLIQVNSFISASSCNMLDSGISCSCTLSSASVKQ